MLSIIQAAGWPIWPLIICSILALALIVERSISLQRRRIAPKDLLSQAIETFNQKIPNTSVIVHLADNSLLGEILASGLRTAYFSPKVYEIDLRTAMQNTGRLVVNKLSRYLQALATIASAAPLLGLLGTVIGMIEIFASQGSIDTGMLTGNPEQLARGISVALYNTAFGLIIAIPALIFWRYFRSRVDQYILEMEIASDTFAKHLLQLHNDSITSIAK